jgi:hypothetical protein
VNTLLVVSLGSLAASAGIFLFSRKAEARETPPAPVPPSPTYGESTVVPLALPSGWRRATSSEVSALPELAIRANALRSTPGFTSMAYGTLAPFTAGDGNTYATWIEQHYHSPGGEARPWGYHHGVTILARTESPVTLLDEWQSARMK